MPDLSDPLALVNIAQQYTPLALPILVFIASLLGSMHCVGMCGGIVWALPAERSAHVAYHGGRLVGYLSLGALAGLLGEYLLAGAVWLSWLAAGLMALAFFYSAYRIWQGKSFHLNLPKWFAQPLQSTLFKSLQGAQQHKYLGGAVGVLTVFLPCGWLYTYILGAVLTGSFWGGAIFLFAFWLGTLPLLIFGSQIVKRLRRPEHQHERRWVAILFLLIGVLTIYSKVQHPLPVSARDLNSETKMECHE